jgi:predicted PurR-regulated permease PerM
MSENEDSQRDSQPQPKPEQQAAAPAQPQVEKPPTMPAGPNSSMPSQGAGWARASTSQVVRTVAAALLTTAVVLGALLLLWQVKTFVGWLVIALFLAAVLNPAVNWLQRRHRLIKRPLAIALTYLGLVVALLFIVGIFLPLLVDQISGFIKFVNTAAQAPEGPTKYIKDLAKQNGLGGLVQRFDTQLADLRKQLGEVLGNLFSATGQIAISAAGFVAALATVLTLTFFLILGSERYVNAGGGLFAQRHQPLVRRILEQAAGAISGYVTGNLAISVRSAA